MTIQQQVNFPLWIDQVDSGIQIVLNIFELLKNINPTLIYLYSDNPTGRFKSIMKERRESWVEEKVEPISVSPWAKNEAYRIRKQFLVLPMRFLE
ncbi:MAG: hypothetical protein ACPGJV_15390 [Bacteriovoracaceae bacterium]